MDKKIIMLVGKGNSSQFMYNGIKNEFNIHKVIVEEAVNRKRFIQRRIKKLGLWKVIGQIIFQILYIPILRKFSTKRIDELKNKFQLSADSFDPEILINVNSVNSVECQKILKEIEPDIVIVNGTRIISKKIMSSINNAVIINTHAGITPKYRGVHGAFWALANDDRDNCGVTVHLVDSGIDTGGILHQKNIIVNSKDNFCTYTYLQIGEGINLMKIALNEIVNEKISPIKIKTESKLWSHPTIWEYLYLRITKGIK